MALLRRARKPGGRVDSGRLDEAERTYREILAMLQAQPISPQQQGRVAVAYHRLGMVAQDRGRLDEAADWYARSLAIVEELGDRPGLAVSYHQLGTVAYQRGRLDEAADWSARSLAIAEELGDRPRWRAATTSSATSRISGGGWMRPRTGTPGPWPSPRSSATGRGWRAATTSSAWSRRTGGGWMRPRTGTPGPWPSRRSSATGPGWRSIYHQLGAVAYLRGRLDEAADWSARSLAITEELGDRPGMAVGYHQLGNVAYQRGRLDEAADWYARSLAITEELGDRPGMADGYHQLGMVAQDRGRLDEAADWYARSLAIVEELGDRPGMALRYGQLGLLAEARGSPGHALEWTVRCMALFDEFPDPIHRARSRSPCPADPPARNPSSGGLLAEGHRRPAARCCTRLRPLLRPRHPRHSRRSRPMSDPIAVAARAAAQQLETEAGPGLVTEVEAVLATREFPAAPPQYVDPVALASLIIAIASLAWTVYTDLKKHTATPSAEVVARTIRVTRRDQGQAAAADHIIEVVVTETLRAAAGQEQVEG